MNISHNSGPIIFIIILSVLLLSFIIHIQEYI